jgi:Skp family chaperone for outer membrane proteins
VKKLILSAILLAIGCVWSIPAAQAQQPAAPIDAGIRIIDLGYIFKEHKGFQMKREGLRADMQKKEADLQSMQQQIQSVLASMKGLNPGSAD